MRQKMEYYFLLYVDIKAGTQMSLLGNLNGTKRHIFLIMLFIAFSWWIRTTHNDFTRFLPDKSLKFSNRFRAKNLEALNSVR